MKELVLHPDTRAAFGQFVTHPSHALLIEAPAGAGKGTLALFVTSELLNVPLQKLRNYSFLRHISAEGNISISEIRDAQQFVQLKTLGVRTIRRVLLLEGAERLTIEAQNAFLKLLEEPPADTVIILTATQAATLLPTIRSRLQTLPIKSPTKEAAIAHFKAQGLSLVDIERSFYMSEGRMGLMHALLGNKTTHPLVQSINAAKTLLGEPVFERMQQVDSLAKDKDSAASLLQALGLVCRAAMLQASDKHEPNKVKRWHWSLQKITAVERAAAANANTKLYLTDLLLNV